MRSKAYRQKSAVRTKRRREPSCAASDRRLQADALAEQRETQHGRHCQEEQQQQVATRGDARALRRPLQSALASRHDRARGKSPASTSSRTRSTRALGETASPATAPMQETRSGARGGGVRRISGDEERRQIRAPSLKHPRQLESVHLRHHHVGHEHSEGVAGVEMVRDRIRPVGRDEHLESAVRQRLGAQPPHGVLIFDEQHLDAARRGSRLQRRPTRRRVRASAAGKRTVTTVPSPGALSTVTAPPL